MDAIIYYLLIILFFILCSGIRVVKEYERIVVFFLGRQTAVRGPGLIYLVPVFEKMVKVSFTVGLRIFKWH